MTDDTQAKREKEDMAFLAKRPEFKRFLFRVIQSAGIFQAVTDGSVERSLDYFEGRRNLGLEILDMAESGQPIQDAHPSGPLLTIIQALLEETQKPATERPGGKPTRYDRTKELDDPDAD